MTRYKHRRMTAGELSDALNALHLSVGDLMRLTGASRLTVENWLKPLTVEKGSDIPHWVAVLLALLRLPGGLDEAWRITDERIIPNAPATPYRGKGGPPIVGT
jgi:hypothetical protein